MFQIKTLIRGVSKILPKPRLVATNSLILPRTCSSVVPQQQDHEPNYAEIANGDPDLEYKLKVITLEAEVFRQEGHPVPESSYMTAEHYKELLKMPSRSARRKYLHFLFKISKKKENRVAKKVERRIGLQEYQENKVEDDKSDLELFTHQYDLSHNNLFLRFYDSTINQMYNNRLVQAMQFGQKMVVDCGYDENMTKRESINAAKQLMLLFAENRFHDEPYDLHFCNANPNGTLVDYLGRHIPTMREPSFPLNIHESSYLDLFPKDKLVYLTPHCREELYNYDHDAIYIIGGLVDKINNEPLSLAKAKKEGLKMAKFPLDKYLQWGSGSGKSLTLNQCVSIMLDVKKTNDWQHALRHVPRRKIIEYHLGENINKKQGELSYDRTEPRKRWTPKENSTGQTHQRKPLQRRTNIRSIFDE